MSDKLQTSTDAYFKSFSELCNSANFKHFKYFEQ